MNSLRRRIYRRKDKQRQRDKLNAFTREYLSSHPCVDCGESDPIVLEFDHVRGVKSYGISRLKEVRGAMRILRAEIEKCDVRCANCHRRKTHRNKDHLRRYDKVTGEILLADSSQSWLF